MSYILANFLSIALATMGSLIFGFAWLKAFRGAAASNLTPARLLVVAVAEFWLAAILAGALILAPPQAGAWVMTVMTPIVIWIGFVVPALAVTLPYRGHGIRAVLIDCGLWLGTMVLQAALLKLVGLVPPEATP